MGVRLIPVWAAFMLPFPVMASTIEDVITESARAARLNPLLWSCLIERESNRNPYALNVKGKGFHPTSRARAQQTLDTLPRKIRLQIRYPWKVTDHQGYVMRFDRETDAHRHARREGLAAGHVRWDAPSIDVGLAQINWYWHGKQFDHLEDLFDPRLNAHYGARYLRQLIDRHGLSAGIGRYHSQKSPERREHYRSLVAGCLKEVGGIEHAES